MNKNQKCLNSIEAALDALILEKKISWRSNALLAFTQNYIHLTYKHA